MSAQDCAGALNGKQRIEEKTGGQAPLGQFCFYANTRLAREYEYTTVSRLGRGKGRFILG